MRNSTRKGMIFGVVVTAAVILISGTLLIGRFFFGWDVETRAVSFRGRAGPLFGLFPDQYQSNGERIYLTGTSATGPPITAEMPGTHRMPSGMMTCATCHAEDGRGGAVRMMMASFTAPDIRYDNLTSVAHGKAEERKHDDGEAGHAEHPPYTDETIKRAVTQGVDPAGESLEWMMPRWRMTDEQLDDLIAYLQTLD